MPLKKANSVPPSLFPEHELGHQVHDSAVLGLTFRDSKSMPIHGWYPYVEGFSARYIEEAVRTHGGRGVVYDPFGGSGTVNLIAALLGVPNALSEANPFMQFVAHAKVNQRHKAQLQLKDFERCLSEFRSWAFGADFKRTVRRIDLSDYETAFGHRDFFVEKDIRELLTLREGVLGFAGGNAAFRDLLMLALASVTVACSNMTRRADLRRRRPDEYKGRVVDVRSAVFSKLASMQRDLHVAPARHSEAVKANSDCREVDENLLGNVSLILTSPPYLNGTNYIRNTKLELWLMGFISSERDLVQLNKKCMVCGINNVVRGRPAKHLFDAVEEFASQLDRVSPDARIPELVRGYFSDMLMVFRNCSSYLRRRGRVILDIGDSRFYGVHVPTDELLKKIAREAGLTLVSERTLARRHSRDKTPLTQKELSFTHAR